MSNAPRSMSRRRWFGGVGAAALSTAAWSQVAQGQGLAGKSKGQAEVASKNRQQDIVNYLRMISDLSGSPTFRYHTGRILSVAGPGKLGEPFVDFIAMKQDRVRRIGADTFQHAYRGVILFIDKDTGKVLEEFDNPLTGKRNVVEQYKTSRGSIVYAPDGIYSLREGMSPGPMIAEADSPFRLAWSVVGDNAWATYDERFEVKGPEGNVVSADNSMYRYMVNTSELEDLGISRLDVTMAWSTETQWWGWMDMAEHPGHLIFGSMGRKYAWLSQLPKPEVQAAQRLFSDHLTGRIEWRAFEV